MGKRKDLKEITHFCYLITNHINNKVYVGVTYKNIEDRFKEHIKVSNSKNENIKQAIHKAIKKYGKENFSIKIIESFDCAEKAYAAEIKYIKDLNSQNKNIGYNQSNGGDCGPVIIKIETDIIIKVLEDFCKRSSIKEITKKYNLPHYTIFDITRLKFSNKHIIPDSLLLELTYVKVNSKKKKRVEPMILINIITDFVENDITISQLSNKYQLSNNNIWNIIHRNTWKNIDIGLELKEKLSNKLLNNKFWCENDKEKS